MNTTKDQIRAGIIAKLAARKGSARIDVKALRAIIKIERLYYEQAHDRDGDGWHEATRLARRVIKEALLAA